MINDKRNFITLIAEHNAMAVMATLFVITGIGFASEKTRIGANFTGAVIAIVAANLNVIPHSAPAYGVH